MFVAERPQDDAGMIAAAPHHGFQLAHRIGVGDAGPGLGNQLLFAIGPILAIVQIQQHLHAVRACTRNGFFDIGQVAVLGPARIVPQAHAHQIGAVCVEEFEWIFDHTVLAVLHAAFFHLVDVGQVRAEIQRGEGRGGVCEGENGQRQ
ncbi:hypothetical protein LA21_06540 [Xanthomonas oryzae pv. oryzae]|nr:hypothetical protein LA21_06540 [Xanthomonas oryzae pv. oryzae]